MNPATATAALNSTTSFLRIAGMLPGLFQTIKSDSLVEYTQPARVEPLAIISSDLRDHPSLVDGLQTALNVFTAYYMQSVALDAAFGDVRVMKTLDKLNPNRNLATSLGIGLNQVLAKESMQLALPSANRTVPSVALEADVSFGKNNAGDLRLVENLVVGKMLEVTFRSGDNSIIVPVVVRLTPISISTPELKATMGSLSNKNTAKERYHRWKSGDLNFVADLLLCNDLIDEHRKLKIRDKNKFVTDYIEKRRTNKLSTLASGQMSVASASNILFMSAGNAKEVEAEIGGKLSDYNTRQAIFEQTGLMIMVVMDTSWDRVVFYTRSIKNPMEISTRELKSMNKGTGPDINEILKAFQLGNAPTL